MKKKTKASHNEIIKRESDLSNSKNVRNENDRENF